MVGRCAAMLMLIDDAAFCEIARLSSSEVGFVSRISQSVPPETDLLRFISEALRVSIHASPLPLP